MKYYSIIFILILFISQCRPKGKNKIVQFPGKPYVPEFIKEEHEHLLKKIYQIILFKDSTGLKAVKLNDLMQHHFKEEEDYVLPPLGLLPLLASGKLPEQSKEVILLTEKLKSELNHMIAEHQLIKAYLDELLQVAAKEKHPEIFEFEKELHKHANSEEVIFFPAVILIGEYLKVKSK